MKLLYWLLSAAMILSLVGCASYFKRKECEKTNWFQHGQNVAMNGQNLENDTFLNECHKVEAEISESQLDLGYKKGRSNYCEPETAHRTGKNGDPFVASMCDGHNLRLLRKAHHEGILAYCQPENGEPAGASGKSYKKVCPRNLETRFLQEFNKGRKKYLSAEIDASERQIGDIEQEIRGIERHLQRKTYELTALGGSRGKTVQRSRRVGSGPDAIMVQDTVTVQEDEVTKNRRAQISSDIHNLESQIRNKRSQQSQIHENLRKLRSEMLAL
ncbi:MAG: hypothetical protein A2Z20_07645 [Bdellovibrionales bacterium RBG_16_40_8]|nr:MAG: hypothetical protein A2Z20_07645 [Bdellovibrionales bacterium RBG_16_40_8]